MAGSSPRGGEPIVGINVTPLVDVTLVLLIIMMVAAPIVSRESLPLALPEAKHGEPAPSPVARVTNTSRLLESLKAVGVWIYGVTPRWPA